MRLEEFSKDDFDLALKRTIRSLTRGKTTSVTPKAILLGGQSGAEKQRYTVSSRKSSKVILSLLTVIATALYTRII